MTNAEEGADFSRGFDQGQEFLYETMYETAQEWYALKVVDDRQYVALLMILHEMEKQVYYEPRES